MSTVLDATSINRTVRTVTLAGGIQSVVADYPELVEAVLRRGAADGQVRKLAGENISRGQYSVLC